GPRVTIGVTRDENRARIATARSGVDALDPRWNTVEAQPVELEKRRQLGLPDGHPALLCGANVSADVLAEAGEHGVEILQVRKPPRVVRRLSEPMPAKRRPVVERGIAACLEMRERTDPLEQRLDEGDLARAAPRTFAGRKQRAEERRQRRIGVDFAEPRRAHDR